MKKCYIASRVKNASSSAETLYTLVQKYGYEPIVWINEPVKKPYLAHREHNAPIAEQFVEYVKDCNLFIFFGSDSTGARGIYVELGIALASSVMGNKKRIIVVDDPLHPISVIFTCHPEVQIVKTVAELEQILATL